MALLRIATLMGALACLVSACGGSDALSSPRSVELVGSGRSVTLTVELADTPAERSRGLMNRAELAALEGMLFVNDEDVQTSFHMKDTLIPLSVAFIAADGEIIGLLDMEPCPREACRRYEPPGAYRFALEVNQGSFERWGLGVGARVVLPEPLLG